MALRARARSVLHEQVLEPASGTRADDRWPKAAAATATKDDDRGSTATKKKALWTWTDKRLLES